MLSNFFISIAIIKKMSDALIVTLRLSTKAFFQNQPSPAMIILAKQRISTFNLSLLEQDVRLEIGLILKTHFGNAVTTLWW
jgi:hypothetical protein